MLPVGDLRVPPAARGAAPETGSGTIDPLVLLAPTLLIVRGDRSSRSGLLLFAFHRLDRRDRPVAARARLPGRPAGWPRHPGMGSAAALLLLLAMGLLVVSTSYRAIVLRNHAGRRAPTVGARLEHAGRPPRAAARRRSRACRRTRRRWSRTEPDIGTGSSGSAAGGRARRSTRRPSPTAAGGAGDCAELADRRDLSPRSTPRTSGCRCRGCLDLRISLDVPADAAGASAGRDRGRDDGIVTTTGRRQAVSAGASATVSLAGAARLLSITLRGDRHAAGPAVPVPDRRSARSTSTATRLGLATWSRVTWRGSDGHARARGRRAALRRQLGAGEVVRRTRYRRCRRCRRSCPPDAWPSAGATRSPSRSVGQQIEVRQVAEATQFPTVLPNAPFLVVPPPALLERELAVPEAGHRARRGLGDGAPTIRAGAHRESASSSDEVRRAEPIEAAPRAAAAEPGRRHALHRGGGRPGSGDHRRRGRPVLRAAAPRLRVRRAPRDGRRAVADPAHAGAGARRCCSGSRSSPGSGSAT